MSRVNKTIPNLQKVWDDLDVAYEHMDKAIDRLQDMVDLPGELEHEVNMFDISAISSLKQHVELMME